MEQYLAFCGNEFYPEGGWNDFVGSYSSTEEAKQQIDIYMRKMLSSEFVWWHIVDTVTESIIAKETSK